MEKNLTPEQKDVSAAQSMNRLTHPNITTPIQQKEARNFLKARTMAPPRAHPAAPQSGGIPQKLAGMQATFHDTVVNTLRGTKYVDLKEQHPENF